MTKLRQKLQISHFDVIRALHYLTNKHGGEKSTGTQKTISQNLQPRPQGFSLKWVGREKALASAGHVHSLNIPEKLIYMQPAGFALTEVERSNNGK